MTKITEKTFIPVSLMIVLLGGSFFVSTLYTKNEAQGEEIRIIRSNVDKARDSDDIFRQEVLNRLGRIEGYLRDKQKRKQGD